MVVCVCVSVGHLTHAAPNYEINPIEFRLPAHWRRNGDGGAGPTQHPLTPNYISLVHGGSGGGGGGLHSRSQCPFTYNLEDF